MSRLEKEYKTNDRREEARISLAIIMAGILMALILSLVANVALLIKLKELCSQSS